MVNYVGIKSVQMTEAFLDEVQSEGRDTGPKATGRESAQHCEVAESRARQQAREAARQFIMTYFAGSPSDE
jgi:hypothetical protein